MSSPVILADLDEAARRQALDPSRSYIVRAPAGSGKTELLIQRFLKLLSIVRRPEAVVAITFTRKAAGEMLERITGALRDAQLGAPVERPHLVMTRELALAALAQDRELGWSLLEHPGRLRAQTIDSLCMAITGEMPWMARLGGMPAIEDDASLLYEDAARRTLLEETPDFQDALTALLRHLDNDAKRARELIALMLARRDQWLPLAGMDDASERARLEETLARIVTQTLGNADRLIPPDLRGSWIELTRFRAGNLGESVDLPGWPAASPRATSAWECLAHTVLTKDHGWRKTLNVTSGFPPGSNKEKKQCARLIEALQGCEGLREALEAIQELPRPRLTDDRWNILRALLQTLRLAVAHLKLVFRERRTIDFSELGTAAREALGKVDNPSELAFRLDSRIEHLLVDEFQDTSRVQYELLLQLTTGWHPGDGRTLFVVGDPMQSIYGFRQAEVGSFLEVESQGAGGLPVESLRLQLNRRSRPAIVDRLNELLEDRFPHEEEAETGAIAYTRSRSSQENGGVVTFDGFLKGDDRLEAECVVRRIRESIAQDADGTIAILVRARTHLLAITQALKSAAIPFQSVDIELLAGRTVVRDLMALTCALLDPADRIAWLAILRAPWCGLGLDDLEALVRERLPLAIEECLRDLGPLSGDGRARAARVRDILAEALDEQGRWPLRRWVERVWIKLGGPACLNRETRALADAMAFFDLLEAEQSGAGLLDFGRFRRRVADLYAQPGNAHGPVLQVMTIHKAKGLEFDTVIVPGLGRLPQRDDSPLVLFHERRSGGEFECLLAPIDETGTDPLYRYLRNLETRKAGHERVRLVYVAATRARKRLHFTGQALDKNGLPKPPAGSMLEDLWPALTPEEIASCLRNHKEAPIRPPSQPTSLRRLPASWRLPGLPQPVAWEGPGRLFEEPHQPSFEWASASLRHTGSVVHMFLQRMTNPDRMPDGATVRRALAHAGVMPTEIDSAGGKVREALERVAASPRGRWILEPHENMRAEYAVSGVTGGEIVRGRVDRTFIEDGVRWIVDFKTSAHQGGGLEEFLDEQQRRYRDRMESYARILTPLGHPVRLGLYFPLLDGWREWTPDAGV